MNLFQYYINQFSNLKNEPYQERGVLPTEAFAFMSYCKAMKVDTIIESGTAFGQSCYLFAKYLDIEVHTVDNISHYGHTAQNIAKERCKDLPVYFYEGDSTILIPNLLERFKNNKVAIFIDGPKGSIAKKFRTHLFNYQNVYIAALHDSVGDNSIGKFSSANHPEFLNTYREFLDSESLKHPYPDSPSMTLGERFKEGMGMDLWYKPRNVMYYVYTGGVEELYNDFIKTSKELNDPYYMALTAPNVNLHADFITYFTEEEKGGTMGPKLNALRRLPFLEGDKVFVTDIDLYFNQNIFDIFNENFDIGVTSRNKTSGTAAQYSPINAGVWCFKYGDTTKKIFDWWYNQLTSPSYLEWIDYKKNHPYSKAIGLREWWVDQDLLNITYSNSKELQISVKDIGPEFNWVVTDEEFLQFKDKKYKVLHRKTGTDSRWKIAK